MSTTVTHSGDSLPVSDATNPLDQATLTALRTRIESAIPQWINAADLNREIGLAENVARCEGRSYGLRDAVEIIDEMLAGLSGEPNASFDTAAEVTA